MSEDNSSVESRLAKVSVRSLLTEVESLILEAQAATRPLELQPFRGRLFEQFVAADRSGLIPDETTAAAFDDADEDDSDLHLTASFQQVSYVLMVATGALMVSRGELTMGALIACSILSGRVLTPFSMVPAQLVQWAQVKAALQSLDQIWRLQDDHEGIDHPIAPESLKGHFQIENVSTTYGGPQQALVIPQ